MQKTKLALVSLLSLLIVVTPVASALAETSNEQDPIRQEKEAEDEPDSNEARGEVFGEIEKEGGDPVTDKKLDSTKGEGLIGAIVGGVVGVGVGIWHGVSSGRSPSGIAMLAFSMGAAGVGAGAAVPEP